jgi:hypothetical protein
VGGPNPFGERGRGFGLGRCVLYITGLRKELGRIGLEHSAGFEGAVTNGEHKPAGQVGDLFRRLQGADDSGFYNVLGVEDASMAGIGGGGCGVKKQRADFGKDLGQSVAEGTPRCGGFLPAWSLTQAITPLLAFRGAPLHMTALAVSHKVVAPLATTPPCTT